LSLRVLEKLKWWKDHETGPLQHRHGRAGERAARKRLEQQGLKFLTANFRSDRGEIDLIFRDGDCLAFVEVKTRQRNAWTRPAAAVNARKRLALTRCAFDYLRLLKNPAIKIRFDVVEVLLEDGEVVEVRHLPNTFTLSAPHRYG
jgi:putative endonuclease